jgi:hypothetical protein
MMTLSLSLSPSLSPLSLSFSMQIQTIRLCSLYSLASRVIFGLYRPFRAFLMMYFDSESRYSYDYGLWSALATYC